MIAFDLFGKLYNVIPAGSNKSIANEWLNVDSNYLI